MNSDYSKNPSTFPLCLWNIYSPPVAPLVSESSRASFSSFNFSNLSCPSAQPPVNSNILGNQNRNPTISGVQCLWEDNGRIICNRWFQSTEELAAHINSCHIPKGTKICHWKDCDRQGKVFPARNKLVNHVRVHTGETPFECDVCGRQFAGAENLKIHRRIHTGEKPYLCPVDGCSERFTTPTQLMIHKKMHIDPKPYHCKNCERKYTSLSSLRKHIKRHHKKQPAGSFGTGESPTSTDLKKHEKTHSDPTPYHCKEEKSTESSNSGGLSTVALSASGSPTPAFNNIAITPVLTQAFFFYPNPYGIFGYRPM